MDTVQSIRLKREALLKVVDSWYEDIRHVLASGTTDPKEQELTNAEMHFKASVDNVLRYNEFFQDFFPDENVSSLADA